VKAINNVKGLVFGLIYGSLSPMPGISAGTLGIFMNVFDSFFHSASFANVRKNLSFTIIFISGWIIGLIGVSNGIVFLLERYEQIVFFCFIGLILGCVPMIFTKAKADKLRLKNLIIFTISLTLMLFLVINSGDINSNSTLQQVGGITPALLAWLFFTSVISAMAMLIPGVGGSLMMLVFGIYRIYLEAVATLNPVLLVVLLSGMVLGILAGIKIIQKLLKFYPHSLYSSILGFIIASVYFIYPGFSMELTEGLLSIALAVSFGFLAYRLSNSGKKDVQKA
jgi:putative membrane protein